MTLVRWATLAACGLSLAASAGAQRESASSAPAEDSKAGAKQPGAAAPGYRYALELDEDTRFRLADQKRDEAIEQLEKDILPKFEKTDAERPDLMFQLSEYYWEKFKYLYAQEEKAQDAAFRAYDAARAKGEKAGPAPKVDHTPSEKYRAKTMGLYEEILKDHPAFSKTDAVLFALGSNLTDLSYARQDPKLRTQAAKRYEELIRRFPASHLAGDTYVQLGDYYFDSNQLAPATRSYERALESKVAKVYSYALYKLAWCDYNRGELENGLAKLHQVVDFAEQQGGRMVDLKNEALNDAVLFYTKLDRPEDALAYFAKKSEEPRRSKLAIKLGRALADAGIYEHSTKVLRHVIAIDPLRPEAPELQQDVVENFEKLRQRKQVKEEVKLLSESYRPGSRWWQANAGNKAVLKNAFEVTEEATRRIVTDYHSEAQKTEQVETFRLARDLYKQYLDAFASSSDEEFVSDAAFNMRFYYAQILWGLEEWEASAAAYDAVVAAKIPGRPEAKQLANEEYRKLAAYNAILAYDKLLKIERGELGESHLEDDQRIREDKKGGMRQVGRIEKREVKNAKPQDLTRFEQKMVAACDAYAHLPAKLKSSKDEVDIRYQAASIFYARNHFDEAARRFREIIKGWPEEKRSEQAADLTMYILEGLEQWEQLKDTSRDFLDDKRLTRPGTDFARRVTRVVEGSHYKWIDEVVNKQQRQADRAAEEFLRFVELYPKAEMADRALTYAMLLLRDRGQFDRAIAAGERVLAEYRGSPLEPKVRYTLASLYEKVAELEKAAFAYEAFLSAQERRAALVDELRGKLKDAARRRLSDEEQDALRSRLAEEKQLLDEAAQWRADAQYNAAVWWEGLGQVDRAAADFKAYQQKFPDRPDVPQLQLRMAKNYEEAGRLADAVRAYQEFERRFGGDKRAAPAEAYAATYRHFSALRQLHKSREADGLLSDLLRRWAKLPEKDRADLPALTAYAHARFLALEPRWDAFVAIRLNRVAKLKADIQQKQRLLAELEKGYGEVLKLGAAEHAIASVIRIGLAHEDMAKDILGSPIPPGLDEDQQQLYASGLERLAGPHDAQALEAYDNALEKAYQLGLYGEWTALAQEKVNAHRPGAYAAARQLPFRGADFFATAQLQRAPAHGSADVAVPETPAPPGGPPAPPKAGGAPAPESNPTASSTGDQR